MRYCGDHGGADDQELGHECADELHMAPRANEEKPLRETREVNGLKKSISPHHLGGRY